MVGLGGEFGALNWTILVVYIVANLALGYFLGKKIHTANDFFLGDRSTPWWAIGISVVATYVSALSFLGGPAWSYTSGLSVIAIHLNYPIVIFLVITLFLPFFYNSGVASIYDYQERRFGPTARSVMSLIFLISQALSSAAVLYATSLVLQFITGIDVVQAIVIVTIVALIYTAMGGIAAVIWTDVIQAGILLIGAGIIFFALLDQLPLSLGETLVELKAAGKTNALNFSFDWTEEATIWSGVIAMTLYHATVYGGNQMMVQRTLAAKNIGDAKKSYLMMGFAAFFIYFLFFFLGILFYSYYGGREFENGNTIILQFAADIGIPGLMGILAAAVMAASMSSLDSAFNSLATVSTVDFYQKYFRRDETPEHYLKTSRIFTFVWALIIIVPAILYAQSEGSILQTLTKVGSYFVGAKLSMYALGFFSKHTTEKGLLVGVAVGFGVIWFVATKTDIAWPWYCAIGAAVNMAVSFVCSLLIDGPQKEYSPYSVKGQAMRFAAEGTVQKDGGWYVVPGKVDPISYLLLVFLALNLLLLFGLDKLI
ncbi:MAG: sodium/solute symporter [Pseudomonadota bacterium]